ncbi:peptide chain release factor N(5)-glutamine methyltransferase [Psychrobium sp. 1_MG-2023]|uniref:peptide chain release factor N(5)-glutamine methyltransferase n=1 Tax=Psychrobium sp. 1_MG-2023 TaxID=3062624 RepID=UPI0026974DF4|nr:peptide chain release factor N(5)-glutamine methyltransferase [Psychrobium sp. 1_MG-2023]MDP2560941.1 peptide chain release factor N(5)-glutamine methyltransferase [Psychrobium sp. 1_MG-2023]
MSTNTVSEVVSSSVARLPESDSAVLDVQVLLSSVLGVERSFFYTWPDKKLTPEQLAAFEVLLQRRISGEPIAYIVGEQEFWSLPLSVAPSTLIPRPETELLVETILDRVILPHARGIDLGTGTGAIALALASEQPSWSILGVDYSDEAVVLARTNQNKLALTNVSFVQSSWLTNIDESWLQQCDFIVSNPPYIDESDPHLVEGDVRFEPHSALIAANNGLQDIIDITKQSIHFLKPQGILLFEHGFEQGKAVRSILESHHFNQVITLQDLAGLDRVTLGLR